MILDPSDGSVLQTIGALDTLLIIDELDFSKDGKLYGIDSDEGIFQIDTTTADMTLVIDSSAVGDELRTIATQRR